jgi:hypothetical protein
LRSTTARSSKKCHLLGYSLHNAAGSVASALPNSTAHSRRNALICVISSTRHALSAAKRKIRNAAGAWLKAWRCGGEMLISDRGIQCDVGRGAVGLGDRATQQVRLT